MPCLVRLVVINTKISVYFYLEISSKSIGTGPEETTD